MSKYAIESYSDALRRELQLVGVAVIKIQPGPFKTEMTGSISRVFEQAIAQSPTFGGYIARLAKMGASAEHKAHPPQVLAQAVYDALVSRRPRAAYSVRADFFRALLSYLPTRWVDAILYKVCKG